MGSKGSGSKVWVNGTVTPTDQYDMFQDMINSLNRVKFPDKSEEWAVVPVDGEKILIHNDCDGRTNFSRPRAIKKAKDNNWYCDDCDEQAPEEISFTADLVKADPGETYRASLSPIGIREVTQFLQIKEHLTEERQLEIKEVLDQWIQQCRDGLK